ncbi:amidase family protein [Roseibium sp.]|uniref:amidase family protein n=1 Tax=Roseibium sp. TaxID=1936156 RepID=UPI003A96BB8C
MDMSIDALQRVYRSGEATPGDIARYVLSRLDAADQHAVWISTASEDRILDRAAELERAVDRMDELPLYGVPFSVKDNIDVAGEMTTAACPAFAYRAECSATVVERALAAGAIYIGKTNLDQFATGLVGVRSPYGIPRNPFNSDYIPGGSSSGAAVSISTGVVSFAFGTDTGGSGRIPASYNGIYGFKPAPGDWSRAGLVYACRSFDTPSVFTACLGDALAVDAVVRGVDAQDPFSKDIERVNVAEPRIAMVSPVDAETFGDADVETLYASAHDTMSEIFPELGRADLKAFQVVNDLMFFGPFLAERDVSVGEFIDAHRDESHPVVGSLIQSSRKFSAADAYRAQYQVAETIRDTARFWEEFDVLVTPTVGALVTLKACEEDPLGPNFRNGTYTNFANPLGLAAISVPFGRTVAGVPWGLTLYALPERLPSLTTVAKQLACTR